MIALRQPTPDQVRAECAARDARVMAQLDALLLDTQSALPRFRAGLRDPSLRERAGDLETAR